MKRWHRKALRALAAPLYPAAEALTALAEWLRSKADRPLRPRPLCFPSETDLIIYRAMNDMMDRIVAQEAERILRGSPMFGAGAARVLSDDDTVQFVKIRTPADGD